MNPRVPYGTRALQNCLPIKYDTLRAEFTEWLKRQISEETANDYIRRLDRTLKGKIITQPKELADILNSFEKKGQRNKFSKAVRNLLNYLEEVYGIDEAAINPYRKVLKIEKYEQSENEFITDEDILEAYDYFRQNLNGGLLLVAELLLFTGLRLRHILRLLAEFDESKLYRFDSFARYNAGNLGRGGKKAFWAYIPIWLADKLERVKISEDSAKNSINYKTKSGRVVSAKSIRKWHTNFMARNGVEKIIRDFIQGRASKDIEAQHYADLVSRADEAYSKIVDKFPIKEEVNNAD